jgi:hypothetical protein
VQLVGNELKRITQLHGNRAILNLSSSAHLFLQPRLVARRERVVSQLRRTTMATSQYQWSTKEIFRRGSTNSVKDRGQRERGSGGGSPIIRASTQFANDRDPYSD